MAEISNETKYYAYRASGDISAHQYNIVRLSDGVSQVNVASLASDNANVGILANQPAAANRPASVAYEGPFKVRAGGAISSAGVWFTCNGSGRAAVAASGNTVLGRITETATADGDVVSCILQPAFRLTSF